MKHRYLRQFWERRLDPKMEYEVFVEELTERANTRHPLAYVGDFQATSDICYEVAREFLSKNSLPLHLTRQLTKALDRDLPDVIKM